MNNRARTFARIETLEARIAPATLDISGAGVVTFTAGSGVSNFLSLDIVNVGGINKYRFDDVENITVTGFGTATGSGSSTVDVNVGGITSLVFNLGDQNDTLLIRNVQHALTVNDGTGADTVRFETNAMTPNGNFSVAAETVRFQSAVSAAGRVATISADNVEINAALSFGQQVTLRPLTPGRGINLGTESAGQLSLTDAELDLVSSSRLQIGAADSGSIELSAAIFPATLLVTTMTTGADVITSGSGAWTSNSLSVQATGNVALTGPNNFSTFAMSATGNGTSTINDTTGFAINVILGIVGLSNPNGTTVLSSGGLVSQFHPITTSSLLLTGAGPFSLGIPENAIGTLAANTTGVVLVKNSDVLTIGTVGGVTGITAGDVDLTARDLAITQPVNVGTGEAFFFPLDPTFTVELSGSGGANTFALSASELNFITSGALTVGSPENAMNVGGAISHPTRIQLFGSAVSGAGSIAVPALSIFAPSINLSGANDVNSLVVSGSNVLTSLVFNDDDGFTLGAAGTSNALGFNNFTNVQLSSASSSVVFRPEAELKLTVSSINNDRISVVGGVTLNTTLTLDQIGDLPGGTIYTLLANDGTDAISGTFNGLPEGAFVPGINPPARISYQGGDGNDVTIRTSDQLSVSVATDQKSATFTDVDGDIVTIKTSKPILSVARFSGYQIGVISGGHLEKIFFDPSTAGVSITITAKPSILGGNGFVNIGFIDAPGVDLGAVSIAGDLGKIKAGSVGGDAKVPGVKSLTVESIGLLGGAAGVEVEGVLGALTVKGDLRADVIVSGADGTLGKATIGGAIVPQQIASMLKISASAGIGSLNVGGDIRSLASASVGIEAGEAIGTISVGGSIVGNSTHIVSISGSGQRVAVTKGTDTAIKSITVKGSVENTDIDAGNATGNADASIGSITVGGDWVASTVIAGYYSTAGDGRFFTNDDTREVGATRDAAAVKASIGSFTVKGQAFGTANVSGDMAGVLAESIGKAKVGLRTFALSKGATPDAFFAAPTLGGGGAELPAFDFIIREFGAATPTVTATGANLALSTDSKTATFIDVDGDVVTVKRSLGTFSLGDFTITPAGIGGLLQTLTLAPEATGKAFNLTITAKVGPNGGNGFINVGEIDADQTDLGTVIIGGELQGLDVGDSDDSRVALGSLLVQSLGALGGTSPNGDEINGKHGLGKIVVRSDIRSTGIFSNNQDSGNLTSLTVGGSVTKSTIQSAAGIGSITIGGSFRDFGRIQAVNRVGAIAVGGDFHDTEVEIFAIGTLAGKGPDLAIGKLTVGGNVEASNFILGRNNNADTGIGTITVGREWIASSILAGTTKGIDGFAGTGDDAKVTLGGPIDSATRVSSIASIVIKGQALGTTANGDHFGIVAEQIGTAKIGTATYAFKPTTKEFIAAAPTGPGQGTFPFETFDFYIREIA